MVVPPPLEHVGKAAVEQLVHAFGVDVASIVDTKHVLREILRRLTPDLLAARLAVEPGIMAGTVHGPVTRAVIEGEALVRADRREADDIAFGTYPAWHLLAEFQDHARSVCVRIGDVQRLVE